MSTAPDSGDGEAAAPLRALVVDDEELARQILAEYLAQHDDVELVGECRNGFEAVESLETLRPDVVFLDIHMPRLDGFEVLELVSEPPQVVFVTAYQSHALRAFDVHAADYLLKPVSAERFAEALTRVRDRLHHRRWQVDAQEYARLGEALRDGGGPLQRVAVRHAGGIEVVPAADIDLLEARDDHVAVHVGGQSWLKGKTLSWFESQLDPAAFVRVHRSYILNLARLVEVTSPTRDRHEALLQGGRRVPVSKAGYRRLREHLE